MAKLIREIVPDPEVLLALQPEDVGAVILEHLNSLPESERENLNRYNFTLPGARRSTATRLHTWNESEG